MGQLDHFIHGDEIHPIDIAEIVAARRAWDFDRLADDQIAMAVVGQWRNYSLTLAWSPREEMLRLICSFDLDPPQARMPALYEVLNLANDEVWDGSFTYWTQQRLMVWRYGLVLAGEALAGTEQIDHMIRRAIESCERFYPAFQLACWGQPSPQEAIEIAMAEAYGRA